MEVGVFLILYALACSGELSVDEAERLATQRALDEIKTSPPPSNEDNKVAQAAPATVKEKPEIWNEKLKSEIYEACRTIVKHEDAFIDLAFQMGPMKGLTAEEVKQYIRYIGNRRLEQLGLEPIYDVQKNPLTWLDTMLNAVEHMNFFEGRATEYSKASTKGAWSDAF